MFSWLIEQCTCPLHILAFLTFHTLQNLQKYVGVQSWKAAHLPTLEIRVEQKRNRDKRERKMDEKIKIKAMLPRPGIEPGTCR